MKKSRFRSIVRAFVTLGIGLLLAGWLATAQQVSIVPQEITVAPDGASTLEVQVSGLTNGLKYLSVDLSLCLDGAVDIVSVRGGNLTTDEGGPLIALTRDSDISPNGKSVLLVVTELLAGPFTGSNGTVYHVTIRGKSTGETPCSINLFVNAAQDQGGNDITSSVTVQNGTLVVETPCTYSTFPTSQNFDHIGGTGSVDVTTQSGCSWTATSNSSWITVTSGSSGTGSGTVSYSVDACTGSGTRTGTMTIAGETFTVTQTCGCTYTISPTSKTFDQAGGTGTVSVTTQSGCSWTATSNSSWITITFGSSGTGGGTVTYSVDACSGSGTRTGTMTIAGKVFTVTQNCASSSGGFVTDKEILTIPEGGTAPLGVKLSAQPLSTTRARISWISGDSDITVKGNASLTFDRTNWNTYQYVTLAAAQDADDENGTAIIRIHRIAGDPISYKDITAIEEDQPGNCVTLFRGWNLMSIPVEPDDQAPEAVFDEVSPLYLFRYNGTDYDSFTSGRLTTVEALNGYWLYLSKPEAICVDGTVLTGNQALQLGRAGWQMIGVPYPVVWGSGTGGSSGPPPPPASVVWGLPAVFSPMVQTPSGSITITKGTQTTTLADAVTAGWIYDTIWEYDTTSGKYTSVTLSSGKILNPWSGYWILTYENNLKLNFSETGGDPDPGPPPPPPAGMPRESRVLMSPPPPPVLSKDFLAAGFEFTNIPNPITDVHTTMFMVKGPMAALVEAIKVQIFDLSGRLVYESGEFLEQVSTGTPRTRSGKPWQTESTCTGCTPRLAASGSRARPRSLRFYDKICIRRSWNQP